MRTKAGEQPPNSQCLPTKSQGKAITALITERTALLQTVSTYKTISPVSTQVNTEASE